MLKKKILACILATTTLLLMASCGGETNGSTEGSVETENATENITEDTVQDFSGETLTIWSFFEGMPYKAAQEFAEKNNVTLDYQLIEWNDFQTKLTAAQGSNEMPDVVVLARNFMPRYLMSGNYLSLDEIWSDKEAYNFYVNNTTAATLKPSYVGDTNYGVGWEANVGAYYYRSDLAKEYFGINSIEEMEEIISTPAGFLELQKRYPDIKVIGDLLGTEQAYRGDYPAYVVDETFTFTKEMKADMEELRSFVDNGLVYTMDDEGQAAIGAEADEWLGYTYPTYQVPIMSEFNQPGQWSIAKSPYNYSNGGSYFCLPNSSNSDLAYEFLSQTFMNLDWLYTNINDFGGYIGNDAAMEKFISEGSAPSEYFGGQDISAKFLEIAKDVTYSRPDTIYDSGIEQTYFEAVGGYIWDGTYATTDEAWAAAEEAILALYPNLTIVYEE